MNSNFLGPKKVQQNFTCDSCHFKCSKKSKYLIHLGTAKHKKITNDNNFGPEKSCNKMFICRCGKTYKYASGLSLHKKNVIIKNLKMKLLILMMII